MRLIDAEALKEEMKIAHAKAIDYETVVDMYEKLVDNAPTVEAERPQGEWLKSDIPESILSKCSLCGFNCGAYTHNFCPNCGADMRGANNG